MNSSAVRIGDGLLTQLVRRLGLCGMLPRRSMQSLRGGTLWSACLLRVSTSFVVGTFLAWIEPRLRISNTGTRWNTLRLAHPSMSDPCLLFTFHFFVKINFEDSCTENKSGSVRQQIDPSSRPQLSLNWMFTSELGIRIDTINRENRADDAQSSDA